MAFATAEAGGEPVDVVLDVGGAITGRVVDAEGSPVEEARVTAQAERPRGPGRLVTRRARTRATGGSSCRTWRPGPTTSGCRPADGAKRRGPGCGSPRAARPTWARSRSPAAARSRAWSSTPRAAASPGPRSTPTGTRTGARASSRRRPARPARSSSRGVPIGPVHVTARHPSYAASVARRRRGGPGQGDAARPHRPRARRARRGAGAAPGRAAVHRRPRARVAARPKGVGGRVGGRAHRRGRLVRDGARVLPGG